MRSKYCVYILSCLIFLSACSIEKRHYTGGYHVEWKHSVKSNNLVNNQGNTSLTQPIIESTSENVFSVITPNQDSITNFNQPIDLTDAMAETIKHSNTIQNEGLINENTENESMPEIESNNPVPLKTSSDNKVIVDPLAIFSMIFDLTGLLIALLTNAPIFIGFALPFIGFIFGFISLCRIIMNPTKNKGLVWAILGTFGAIIILTVVLLVVLI